MDKERRKGKGRRFCLVERFIQFLTPLAVLPRTILNNRMNCTKDDLKEKDESILFLEIVLGKIASTARN